MAQKFPIQTPPTQLWHYTSFANAGEIIKTHSLFASLSHLADQRFATELLIEDLFESAERSRWLGASEEIRPVLEESFGCLGKGIYVVSFSGDGDVFKQWERYGQGPHGIALKFNPNQLIDVAKLSGFELVECFYEREQQRAILFDGLRQYVARFYDLPSDSDRRRLEREKIAREIAIAMSIIALSIKDPVFSEEKEWRLVESASCREAQWYVSPIRDRPRYELSIRRGDNASPPVGAIIGPPAAEREAAADFLMQQVGINPSFHVTYSQFRDL